MSAIFISYRRADAGGHAGRLFDRLRHWFDADDLFYDVDGIDSGQDFPARLDAAVRSAQVVLVVIGPDWLASLQARATMPEFDYVRREVALALQLNATRERPRLIPVLVGGVAAPGFAGLDAGLAADLGAIARFDAHEFRGKQDDWDNQFVRLRNLIAQLPAAPAPRFRAPAGTVQPFRVIEHSLSAHFQDPNGVLATLRARLDRGAAVGVARAALYGMGGVGKTQLALKYSHEYRDAYAGIWWFRAETDASLQLDAHDVCVEVAAHVNDGEPASAAFRRWLAHQPGSWLLVFDNAEDPAALRPRLPDAGRHHVIVTSRNPAWGGLAQSVELDVWTAAQAARFLRERLPGSAEADQFGLADDLGGLPLALEQAASYIEATAITDADYRELLAGVETGGLTLDEGRAATGYERSVAATLAVAFERLTPAAAQLLRLCAFAAPEPLPERFFVEASDKLPAELSAACASPLAWNRVISELLRFGLTDRVAFAALDRAPAAPPGRTEQALIFHRLTQQISRARLATPAQDCRVLQSVLRQACPTDARLPAHWPRFAVLVQHVALLDRFFDAGLLDTRSFSWLLDRLAAYLSAGPALFAEAVHCHRRALDINRSELGDEHPDTLTSMNNLAATLWAQGELPGARRMQEQVLEGRRLVLGDEHPDTLTSMNNLAQTLKEQGDLPVSRWMHEQALEVKRRVLGDEHPDTLTSMNNLAGTLQAQGELPAARRLQEQVLAVSRRVLGDEHPETLTSMNNLAETLRAQGDLPGARRLHQQALEVRRRVLGDEHPDTLFSMNNLALTLSAQGDLLSTRQLQDMVLAVIRRVLGDAHPHTLSLMNNLAHTLRAQGDLPGARRLHEQVLEDRRHVLGDEHPDTLTSMDSLADTLRDQGDLPGARRLHEQALEDRRRVPGDEHPETLTSMNNLAETLRAQGDLPAARRLHEQVLESKRRVLGDEHPETLTSMNNLAITLWHDGDRGRGVRLLQTTVDAQVRRLGSDHPNTQASIRSLAEMRAAMNTGTTAR